MSLPVIMISDGAAAAGVGVLVITVVSGQLIFRDAAGGSRDSSPAFRNADATAAALISLATAMVAAFLVMLAFAPPADAVVLLPKTNEQKEQSASRARALTANPAFPVQAAQRGVDALLADEETFRAVVTMGLPTGVLQMPIRMEKGVFLNLELSVTDPTALRAAAEAYMQDAAKAEEYLTYAEGAQLQGDSESIRAYLDSAFAAAKRCQTSLQRVLAQLPAGPST